MKQSTCIAVDAPAAPAAVPTRQEITFADGSVVWLHACAGTSGKPFVFGREIPLDDGSFWAISLTQAAPELQYALPAPSARETADVVFRSLRKRFESADQFRRAVGAPAS